MEASDVFDASIASAGSPIGVTAGAWWYLNVQCDSAPDIAQALATLSRQGNYIKAQMQSHRRNITRIHNVD